MRFRFGDFVFDTQRQELCRLDVEIPLEPKAFQVLSYLLTRHGQAVSKEELLDACWQGEFVTDSAIARSLKVIRQAVADDGAQQHTIRTLRKFGYRFVAPVEVESLTLSEAASSSIESPPAQLETIAPNAPSHAPLSKVDFQGARSAILMGNGTYPFDEHLPDLQTPERDVKGLAEVLSRFEIAQFQTVHQLHNATHRDGLDAVTQLVQAAQKDDVMLVFFSGHAQIDPNGTLYLAYTNTQSARLDATALSLTRLKEVLDTCQATRIILILDFCFSSLTGPEVTLETIEAELRQLSSGRGKFILHATPSPQDISLRQTEPHSPLTRHVIDGLRTGNADLDRTGSITLDQLYHYTVSNALEETLPAPVKWDPDGKGNIILATSQLQPIPAPPDRITQLSSTVKAHYDAITQLFKKGDVIPCLGPGIAASDPASQPPIDAALARRLAREAGFAEDTDSVSLISQKLQIVAGRGILYETLREIYQPHPYTYSPSLIHRFLAGLPNPLLILSTAYDTLVEEAFDAAGKDYAVVAHILHTDSMDRGKVVVQYSTQKDKIEKHLPQDLVIDLSTWSIIYKLHGTFGLFDPDEDDEIDSIVITEEDYLTLIKLLDHPQSTIPNHIARHLKKRMCLFLGYPVSDWNFRAVADVIQDKGNFRRIQPYVIHDHTTEFERLYWDSKRVRLLETDTDAFIQELADTIGIDV